jgi:hypothetical protein
VTLPPLLFPDCTVNLLFYWFGLVCFANTNKKCQLSYSIFQTSQTEGQQYSDTSPFSIPWSGACNALTMHARFYVYAMIRMGTTETCANI